MKTKLKIMGAATIVATGFLIGFTGSKAPEGSTITLANVEALTHTETIEYDKCCLPDADLNCIPNYMGLIPGIPTVC